MLQGAIDLILVPGSSLKLVPVINLSVLCLLVVLCCLTYSKIASIHLFVMSFLALGLLASVNW
jgi:ER protein Pkr1